MPLSARGWALVRYLTRQFNCETTASLFEVQRRAFAAENEKKQKALAEGKKDSPQAKQPWLYCYSLRRSSFLMGGDTLDYFDFYRKADNAFMYETSNRDPRVWQWDSYMCDVGRILSAKFGTRFGPCIKPHRARHGAAGAGCGQSQRQVDLLVHLRSELGQGRQLFRSTSLPAEGQLDRPDPGGG